MCDPDCDLCMAIEAMDEDDGSELCPFCGQQCFGNACLDDPPASREEERT